MSPALPVALRARTAADAPRADKSIQSAGAAGVWRADAVGIPYMNLLISTWSLLVAGLVCALPMIHMRVQDRSYDEEL